MTPPEDAGIATWLAEKAWMIISLLVAAIWKQNDAKHKETRAAAVDALTAHAAEDEKAFKALHEEQQVQRGHIAKIFDQMRDESRLSMSRHIELLNAIHSKADK